MDREPPESPDYFENFEKLDPALYKSPSPPLQLPLPLLNPSLHGPSNRLISAESEAQVPYVSNALANDNSEHFGTSSVNLFPITFVSKVPVARRGRPPNPEKQQQPEKETRNPGRPPDPTKHRPYSGPRTSTAGPQCQRTLGEWGVGSATAPEPISTTSIPVQAPAVGPRIEHVVPDADPDQIVDPDDADTEDLLGLMGEGQGNDDDACSGSDEDIPAGKRNSLPPFVKTAYEKFVTGAERHYQVHQTFWVPQKANIFLLGGNLRSKAAAGKPTAEAMYNARLFYWDPRYFVEIACPACGTELGPHGYTRPRRMVDLHDCFYMVGRRSKTDKETVTFNSWDPRIMKALPAHLLDEFPAYLSHRGAMAKPVFEMMRTVFHYGLGSKQFSNSLQVLHRLHFDKLHAQYLDGVIAWVKAHPEKIQQDEPLLNKNKDPIRVSSNWNNDQLSPEQIKYAALDALASLYIYDRLAKAEVLGKISESDLAGTLVSVHHTDGQLIAKGRISMLSSPIPGAPQATKTRVRVTVSEVCVPAALVPLHNKKALETFGPVPFDIVYARTGVFRRIPEQSEDRAQDDPSNAKYLRQKNPASQAAGEAQIKELLHFFQQGSEDVAESASSWMKEIDSTPPEFDSNGLDVVQDDQAAVKTALDLLDNPEFSTWSLEIRSRVIMDVWHAMARVKVSKEHGMRRLFGIALRDAIFIPSEEDKARIEAYLKTQNSSWEHQLRFNACWLWRRCRQTVPPPDKLYDAVNEVFKVYGPQKDSKTNLPLFNAQAWNDAKNVLKAIKLGLLSDPPGVQLYYQMYIEKKINLPILRCARGTNNPEGAIHKNLRDRMPKSGTSIRHAAARIKDYVFVHNLVVGTLNRSGKIFHWNWHDIWFLMLQFFEAG
ncbi:hypothetical protein C8R44DRAFT_750974 [Mycena epipterygia]|nr:hypothetical protein C8R44DRAFT_750974 [Mycena epipterygia]